MAIKVSYTFTRPSTEVEWFWVFKAAPDAKEIVDQAVADKELIVYQEIFDSGLKMKSILTFANQDILDKYRSNPVLLAMWKKRDEHCLANNITYTVEETII